MASKAFLTSVSLMLRVQEKGGYVNKNCNLQQIMVLPVAFFKWLIRKFLVVRRSEVVSLLITCAKHRMFCFQHHLPCRRVGSTYQLH